MLGMSKCTDCPAGKFGAGIFSNLSSEAKGCSNCPEGKIGQKVQGSMAICTICKAGRFSNRAGLSMTWLEALGNFCEACPAGKYSRPFPRKSCIDCVSGKYSTSDAQAVESTCKACPQGRWGSYPGQQSIEKCIPCPLGKFGKEDAANSILSCDNCAAYSTNAVLGSNSSKDCFCSVGNYFLPSLKSCSPCFSRGVICPGGFASNSSVEIASPQSAEGWYPVSLATAATCKIQLPDGRSVCRGGSSFRYPNKGCAAGHRGPLCSACELNYARDKPSESCTLCSEYSAQWMLILQTQFDCSLKAALGLFMAYRATCAITSFAKLDSVLLRLFMHFTTVASVVKSFDFSSDSKSSGDSLQGSWFLSAYSMLYQFGGNLPPVVPMGAALECLAVNLSTSRGGAHKLKRTLPITFWLLYPLMVTLWMLIVSVLAAKIYWHLVGRAKVKFVRMLVGAGVAETTACAAVEQAGRKFVRASVTSTELPSLDLLAEKLGTAVVSEIVSERAMDSLHSRDGSPLRASVRHLGSKPAQKRFISAALQKAIMAEKGFLASLEHNPQLESEIVSTMRKYSHPSSLQGENSADDDNQVTAYPIFRLFRRPSIGSVMKDCAPVVLITLSSIWMVVTYRFMAAIHTVRIQRCTDCDTGITEEVAVWAQDMRLDSFADDHFTVGILGCIGLIIWSLGVPLSIFLLCYIQRFKLHRFATRRMLGYFILGFQPSYFWWDLLVKRCDLLMIFFVAYSSVLNTRESKLMAFQGISAFMCLLNATFNHYDSLRCQLADRLESKLLLVRLLDFFGLNVIVALELERGTFVFVMICAFLMIVNIYVVLLVILCIISEMCGAKAMSFVHKDDESDRALATSRSKQVLRATVCFIAGFLGSIENERQCQVQKAPVLVWDGAAGIAFAKHPFMRPISTSSFLNRFLLQPVVTHIYMTDAKSQHHRAVMNLCDLLVYVVLSSGITELPRDILGNLIFSAVAIRQISGDLTMTNKPPSAQLLYEKIGQIRSKASCGTAPSREACSHAAQDCADTLALAYAGAGLQYYATAEDLSCALMYLQRLHSSCVQEFVNSRFMHAWSSEDDKNAGDGKDAEENMGDNIGGMYGELEIQSGDSDLETRPKVFQSCLCSPMHC